MKINIKEFRVPEGKKVKLDKWPTQVKPVYQSKKEYKDSSENGSRSLVRNNNFNMHPTVMRCC